MQNLKKALYATIALCIVPLTACSSTQPVDQNNFANKLDSSQSRYAREDRSGSVINRRLAKSKTIVVPRETDFVTSDLVENLEIAEKKVSAIDPIKTTGLQASSNDDADTTIDVNQALADRAESKLSQPAHASNAISETTLPADAELPAKQIGFAESLLANDSIALTNRLTGAYAKIAEAARAEGLFAGRAQLEASEHEIADHKQSLLPQITPSASYNSEGDTIVNFNVDQVLYDSGRYTSTKNILMDERDIVEANLKIDESDKIANAISAYIQYHHSTDSQNVTAEVAWLYDWFEKQSEVRLNAGIGDNSERDLFNLKKIEAQAEMDDFKSEALASEKKLRKLAGMRMPKEKPPRLKSHINPDSAPEVELAAAERDRANSQLDFDRADRMPRVSLTGNIGTATDSFDQEDLDMRVQVSMNQAINWGYDRGLASSRSRLEASRTRFEEARRDVSDRAAILKLEIQQAEDRIKRLQMVLKVSKHRLNGFDEQFLAGTTGIVEAVSIIETYKKSSINLIDSKYTIHNLELKLSNLMGTLLN